MTTVAQVIVDQLTTWGVDSLYGVAGDSILPLLGTMAQQNQVRFIPVKHESSAGFMASAQAKLHNNVGFCLVHAGPGLANALNGIADAANDRVPMVVLSGQVSESEIGTYYKQYLDESRLIEPLAVYSAPATDANSVVELMTIAYHRALADKGVAHISLPLNLLSQESTAKVNPNEPYLRTAPHSSHETIMGVIPLLNAAQRPLILLGRGGRRAGALAIHLAEMWGAGIIVSLGAKGAVPGGHSLVIGGLGQGGSEVSSQALSQTDLLLMIGNTWWPKGYVPQELPVVQIDRQPEHIGLSTPVKYGIVGEAEKVLKVILEHWHPSLQTQWAQKLQFDTAQWWSQLKPEMNSDARPILPQRIVADLEQAIAPDAIITLDVGDHTVWFNRIFRGTRQEVLISGNWRSMGFGIPAAIQAKLLYPNREVVAFVGDGGFAMTQMELCTASRYGLPIMVVVINNGCLAMEQNRMLVNGMNPYGVDLTNPDFVTLAKACGGEGRQIDSPDQLLEAFSWGLAQSNPVVIDVKAGTPLLPHTKL
jgi:pyruvate oxidase